MAGKANKCSVHQESTRLAEAAFPMPRLRAEIGTQSASFEPVSSGAPTALNCGINTVERTRLAILRTEAT